MRVNHNPIAIIVLLLLHPLIADCPKGSCIKCEVIDETNSCTRCIYRVTDQDNNECGPSIEQYINDNSLDSNYFKHCEGIEVSANKARCFLCKEGYALAFNEKCLPIKAENCFISRIDQFETEVEKCLVCKNRDDRNSENYFPDKDNGLCINLSPDTLNRNENIGLEGVCSHGSTIISKKTQKTMYVCALCRQNGYVVTVDEDDVLNNYGRCIPNPSNVVGCGRVRNKKCIWCNHYDGYYMVKPGICDKSSRLLTLSLLCLFAMLSFK